MIASKAAHILNATALSEDDVLVETTIDVVTFQLMQSVHFFQSRLEENAVAEAAIPRIQSYCEKGEKFARLLNEDYAQEIEILGESMPVYIATALHLNELADQLRAMNLNPEWKEYYDDMARKLDEYAEGLRLDPTSSFRAI